MFIAPGEIKVSNKHDINQHAAQEKVATSTHSMNDAIAFLCIQYSLQIKRVNNIKRRYILY